MSSDNTHRAILDLLQVLELRRVDSSKKCVSQRHRRKPLPSETSNWKEYKYSWSENYGVVSIGRNIWL